MTTYHDVYGPEPESPHTPPEESNPYWLPDEQPWAREQARQHHDEATYRLGEYTMFVMLWRVEDFEAGLVGRCPTCYLAYGEIAEAYGQSSNEDCPTCYGTTFAYDTGAGTHIGYRARVVRPAIWVPNVKRNSQGRRGEEESNTTAIQTTADFQLRTGDVAIRADNSRWKMRTPTTNFLRTGFAPSTPDRTNLGFHYAQFDLEDEATVTYDIPPTDPALIRDRLDVPVPDWTKDFSDIEEAPGPLFPPS